MKVYLDSDVLLDFLLKREPFFEEAIKLFFLKDDHELSFYTSAIIFSNIYYISSKHFEKKILINKLKDLATLVEIVDSTNQSIHLSFDSGFSDFEDAIQYYTAIENDCAFLITRNVKDYKKGKNIRVLTSSQFCKLLIK